MAMLNFESPDKTQNFMSPPHPKKTPHQPVKIVTGRLRSFRGDVHMYTAQDKDDGGRKMTIIA